MKVREQVTVTADFPAGVWVGDQESCLAVLRGSAAQDADRKGMTLLDDPESLALLFMRDVPDGEGGTKRAECVAEQAEHVRARLVRWAAPA